MRGVQRPSNQLLPCHHEHERRRRNCGKAEGIRGGAHEDLRGHGSACLFLVIDDWTGPMRPQGVVAVVAGQMHMERLSMMVFVLLSVEMHVHQRRADSTGLHEHNEDGRGQPAKHRGIVVKDERPVPDDFLTIDSDRGGPHNGGHYEGKEH